MLSKFWTNLLISWLNKYNSNLVQDLKMAGEKKSISELFNELNYDTKMKESTDLAEVSTELLLIVGILKKYLNYRK